MSRSVLAVESVDNLPNRPWLFVSGRLAGEPLVVGAEVTVRTAGQPDMKAEIRGVEFHNAPGLTTIRLDAVRGAAVATESTVVVD
jgi:hypothetical protein